MKLLVNKYQDQYNEAVKALEYCPKEMIKERLFWTKQKQEALRKLKLYS